MEKGCIMVKQVVSIGVQSFEMIRKNHSFYVDKTELIREWWESQDIVTLLTRPRRFGKTLNLSMLECFFSKQYQGWSDLFEGLSVWKDEKYRNLQGSYPVIFLSFANIKGKTYEEAREGFYQILLKLYGKFSFLREAGFLSPQDIEYFDSIKLSMTEMTAVFSLHSLSDYLSRYYGKKVLIFLDEYDTPLQEAYIYGYWDKLISFIRSFFNASFKTNPYMERAFMTGITRISKESIFSDINNLEVVTTTSFKYCTMFGFTEEEVDQALCAFQMEDKREKVKEWYDGFTFGNKKDIYNPWSITNLLDKRKLKTYWANTSSNRLMSKLIQEGTADVKMIMEDLLEGKSFLSVIDEEVVFDQLDQNDEAIWSLFLASGYLKVDELPKENWDEDGEDIFYSLSFTNLEVRKMFRKAIQTWFSQPNAHYNDFVKALLANDVEYMNRFINQVTLTVFSSFDVGNRPSKQSEPERFYHGFVLGLMADSKIDYWITSNRESGFGRYDVMMEPKNKKDPAYILEFKVHEAGKEANLEDTVKMALKQIEEKNYDAVLMKKGIEKERIYHYGFAFEGKRVLIG